MVKRNFERQDNPMKSFIKTTLLLFIVAAWVGCSGDYRQQASGAIDHVVVVMDSTQFHSQTADAIRGTFGRWIQTLPNPEPLFDLSFRDFDNNAQLNQLKKFKNIIVAAPIDDSTNTARFIRALLSDKVEQQVRDGKVFAFPLQNKWYKNQWSLLLTAPSDSALAKQINNSEETLTDNLMEKTFVRWRGQVYDRGEKTQLEDSLWNEHGWKIRVQHDWYKNVDTMYTHNGETAHFLTMDRQLPSNDRWFWIWWKKTDDISYLSNDWINAKRDSLMEKWVRGTRDSSYVTTDYKHYPVNTTSFKLNGNLTYETLGVWHMTHDAMAGPFVNLAVYDEDTHRLFLLEFDQFAPKYKKRRFVRQFRAMIRTFQSDSTWTGNNNNKPMAKE
ncbi:MAG TPA: DUF4837 family protein [Balneolaceae bacterium]|nr:DUF4837 family protein [Balneolaceae bacterium]